MYFANQFLGLDLNPLPDWGGLEYIGFGILAIVLAFLMVLGASAVGGSKIIVGIAFILGLIGAGLILWWWLM